MMVWKQDEQLNSTIAYLAGITMPAVTPTQDIE